MKKRLLPLLFLIALTGCAVSQKNPDVKKEAEKGSSSLVTSSIIKTNINIICTNPVEKQVYLTLEEWQAAIDGTDNSTILDISSEYDETFFEDYALCYLPIVASGGMDYKLKDVSIAADANGNNTLTVNTTYSTKKMLNTQVCYEFFISLNKNKLNTIDNVKLSETCRD